MDDESRMSHAQRPNQDREYLQRLSLSQIGREYFEQFSREADFSIGTNELIERNLNERHKKAGSGFRFPHAD